MDKKFWVGRDRVYRPKIAFCSLFMVTL